MKTMKIILAVAGLAGLLYGCERIRHEGDMTVKMTDAPSSYSEVNVDIQYVQVHYEDERRGNSGWVDLETKAGIYNLLELQNNVTVILSDERKLQAGKITQMRLVLGKRNSLVTANVTYAMQVPSGYESGLKLDLHTKVAPGKRTEIVLDFDADRSVVLEANGTYSLKPVITVKSITTY